MSTIPSTRNDQPDHPISIRLLDAPATEPLIAQLCSLLQDGVAGASLGFWHPLDDEHARDYWRETFSEVEAGARRLLVAERGDSVVGTVQLALPSKQNAARRAEIQKLMVHHTERRQSIGQTLMRVVERLAYDEGRTLLVLDTNTGSGAEQFYQALGYQRVGVIPRYTIGPDGMEYATTVFYKSLETERQNTAPDGSAL